MAGPCGKCPEGLWARSPGCCTRFKATRWHIAWREHMKIQKLPGTVAILLAAASGEWQIFAQVPKTWDTKDVADWATPVAGLNVRPGHFSEKEYYRAPV